MFRFNFSTYTFASVNSSSIMYKCQVSNIPFLDGSTRKAFGGWRSSSSELEYLRAIPHTAF
jgi:hypothetical protein